MEYKLMQCEDCKNLISVIDDEEKPVYVCPVCGNINDRITSLTFNGFFSINSPTINHEMEMEDVKKGIFKLSITSFEEELQDAIMTMLKYGWDIKFNGQQIVNQK